MRAMRSPPCSAPWIARGETWRGKCGGLDAVGMRTTVGTSTITLGGLLKHLTNVEPDAFLVGLFGREPGPPWDTVDWDADPDWDWNSAAQDKPEQLMTLWQDAVARSRLVVAEALADGGMDRLAPPNSRGQSFFLRRIVVDMIEEYARHVGHAHLIREPVEGLVEENPPA